MRIKTKEDYKINDTFLFQSANELINYAENAEVNREGIIGSDPSSDKTNQHYGYKWCDVDTFEQAIAKARTGDYEIAKDIKPKEISLRDCGKLACISYDTEGDFVDIGKYLTGEPECMGSMRRKGKPIIKILYSASYNSDIKADTVERRGKAILEVMSSLEQSGYGVEIWTSLYKFGTGYVKNNRNKYYQHILGKVKDSKEYYNLPSLAYWLTSPSVLRKLSFRINESLENDIQKLIGSGYGRSVSLPKEYLDQHDDMIYFPAIEDNYEDYSRAVEQIINKYEVK